MSLHGTKTDFNNVKVWHIARYIHIEEGFLELRYQPVIPKTNIVFSSNGYSEDEWEEIKHSFEEQAILSINDERIKRMKQRMLRDLEKQIQKVNDMDMAAVIERYYLEFWKERFIREHTST